MTGVNSKDAESLGAMADGVKVLSDAMVLSDSSVTVGITKSAWEDGVRCTELEGRCGGTQYYY